MSLGEKTCLRPLADGVFVESSPGVKPGDLVACMRVRINGLSRIQNMKKFALSTRIKVEHAATAAYTFSHSKVEVCLHRYALELYLVVNVGILVGPACLSAYKRLRNVSR